MWLAPQTIKATPLRLDRIRSRTSQPGIATEEGAVCSIAKMPGRSRNRPVNTASDPEILFMALAAFFDCRRVKGKCGVPRLVPCRDDAPARCCSGATQTPNFPAKTALSCVCADAPQLASVCRFFFAGAGDMTTRNPTLQRVCHDAPPHPPRAAFGFRQDRVDRIRQRAVEPRHDAD